MAKRFMPTFSGFHTFDLLFVKTLTPILGRSLAHSLNHTCTTSRALNVAIRAGGFALVSCAWSGRYFFGGRFGSAGGLTLNLSCWLPWPFNCAYRLCLGNNRL